MKVCLSIAPSSMAEALKKLRDAPAYVDLVEVRTDGITDLDMEKLLRRPRPPVIITNRRLSEGGKFAGAVGEQLRILSGACRLGPEFVDIELSWGTAAVAKILGNIRKHAGRTNVICSYHDFQKTPSNLPAIYRRMRSTGAHIVKIAAMAGPITDNGRILSLLEQAQKDKQPAICFCMGENGQMSRILSGKYNAFLSFGSNSPEECTAPGQMDVRDLKYTYRIDTFNRRTKVFGLVGNPVSQSKGIYFHNSVFARRSLNAVYVNFLVADPGDFLNEFREIITGLSITMPFKESIIGLLDSVESDAARICSVNSVINRRGKLCGYNTDLPAIISLIRKRTNLKNKRALVLGTGATSKTMAYAAIDNGARTTIAGRSAEKARALAGELQCSWTTFEHLASVPADIVLNGTPVGMNRHGDAAHERLLPKGYLRRGMIVFDAVYNPPKTRLLRDAETAGCEIITGVELFTRQAQLQSGLFLKSIP